MAGTQRFFASGRTTMLGSVGLPSIVEAKP
jgi:hypothetical protein